MNLLYINILFLTKFKDYFKKDPQFYVSYRNIIV